MIIFRYLSREVLLTLTAVSGVLLVITMSGRFIRYLAQAAQGALDPSVLLLIMGYRIPGFLQLILPLGLFLGILLAYGRLYLESEMTVLNATGMSSQRLLGYTFFPALVVALLVAWLSFFLTPQGITQVNQILHSQDSLTEFDTLEAGRFQGMRDGTRVTYTEALDDDKKRLKNLFISEKRVSSSGKQADVTVLVAETGWQEIQPNGERYLILQNGYRYDGEPGSADYRVIKYDTYGVLLPKPSTGEVITEREAMPTSQLIGAEQARLKNELQWRIALPILVFVVTLIAVPLAKVNPRQGRFLKLLPAIFLYMLYLGMLIFVRSALDKGNFPAALGLWPVHLLFALIGLLLVYWESIQLAWAARRQGAKHA